MVDFTIDEIRAMMDVSTNIRNMSVIAHVDHGKSTLSDSLIAHAGIIAKAKAGDTRFMQTREDEQARTITIKSSSVSLFFQMHKDDLYTPESAVCKELKRSTTKETAAAVASTADSEVKHEYVDVTTLVKDADHVPFLINLIDSPGHVDFSSEVTAALRVTDGALVVVDCVEGVAVQTETVLRQAISERIKPVLFLNKVDRCFTEMQMDVETIYQNFRRAIESVNVIVSTYKDDKLGDVQVYPEKGTVGFGSGFQAWGFTLSRFAKFYASKFGVAYDKLMNRFWGENFFDPEAKTFTSKPTSKSGKPLERTFCQFILSPIQKMFEAIQHGKKDVWSQMLSKLNIKLTKEQLEIPDNKSLLKEIMRTWLPAAESLLSMIANHLPSPVIAQAYRMETLYSGPQDDECAVAIRKCDPNGPLMLYVSKMFPTADKGRFYAFGRVFAGRVASGQEVRIQGPDYIPGRKADLNIKKIQRCVLMMGRFTEQLQDCPCGNIVSLVGVDQYLLKSGTITTHPEAHNFHTMKYSVSPVVRKAVEVVNAGDLPKLIEGLKRLAKSDPLVQIITTASGEHIIAGAGELHLEICIKDLREDFMKGAPLREKPPVVSYCETVKSTSEMTCVSKSPNKHNRLYVTAQPMGEELSMAIEKGDLNPEEEMKVRARKLADEFKWDVTEARKIWAFGMNPDAICNVLVDMTKAVDYLNEIKDSVCTGFQQATMAGVFTEETMRGIRFNLHDVTLHADAIHRGAGQIMPTIKRVLFACQFKSEPALMEPMYLCNITVPRTEVSGVYSTMANRRGIVESSEEREGTPLNQMRAFLPVAESFGFTSALRAATHGQAFPQMIFSHWQVVPSSPVDEGSQAYKIVMDIRKRKGMKEVLPDFNDYFDKI